ncbi:type VI secretion system amidase immunity protein Tai4 [Ralstonia solanacearum]|uniref:Uncharacterized protein n=2 Tax=Ralstonia solanacearum TaxID=305 RepID=F6G9K9_RALS8|nr:type VI secretion system amidase immunity protein Tai4 [Ralstonia solanacearum]AEG71923.1 conserved hypothetical protein [Ralstonia solanacearum Po82]AYB63191.1 hypothetical protein C2124_22295 [Ralstonia solanacearum]MBB6588911.1 type VI secretion system amidase immunity protein Tai4 [Ralstonia solanacearum]MCG3573871.1 type VI secretion system amidase immunity protein Tai4 [Ralstonia solanacearum]MCL9823696.1 type VI secretion system amidase immunity protein Tai4 [Ralstonia solanacearum]
MVLATCIANAYRSDKDAAEDAGSSVSALRDWTRCNMEKSPDAVRSLVDRYLARNQANPLADAEIKGLRFDFLKCLDLYHSPELAALARRIVIHPGHIQAGQSTARGTEVARRVRNRRTAVFASSCEASLADRRRQHRPESMGAITTAA